MLLLAAVGLYGAVGGLVPGLGLRLDRNGFHLKSFGKSWGADWLEVDGFVPKRVRVGRARGRRGRRDRLPAGHRRPAPAAELLERYRGAS